MSEIVLVKIKRRENPQSAPYWETFELPNKPFANVISVLQDIQRNPVNIGGVRVKPVVWDCNCLEEVCGSCTMVINGRVRQACAALIDSLEKPVTLEPMSKFPAVRDLQVDRSRMFRDLQQAHAWIDIDGTHDIGEGPVIDQDTRHKAYELSQCMTCGCCLESCPQYTLDNNFLGPAVFSQARYFNMHPTGAMHKDKRLEPLIKEGGIANCGNAQNCAAVCPKHIPLTESIAEIGRQTTFYLLKKLFTE